MEARVGFGGEDALEDEAETPPEGPSGCDNESEEEHLLERREGFRLSQNGKAWERGEHVRASRSTSQPYRSGWRAVRDGQNTGQRIATRLEGMDLEKGG
jgi:hypothetical protein